jgi:hypothetical protein
MENNPDEKRLNRKSCRTKKCPWGIGAPAIRAS